MSNSFGSSRSSNNLVDNYKYSATLPYGSQRPNFDSYTNSSSNNNNNNSGPFSASSSGSQTPKNNSSSNGINRQQPLSANKAQNNNNFNNRQNNNLMQTSISHNQFYSQNNHNNDSPHSVTHPSVHAYDTVNNPQSSFPHSNPSLSSSVSSSVSFTPSPAAHHIESSHEVADILFTRRLETELLQGVGQLQALSFDPLQFVESTFPDVSIDRGGKLHGYIVQLRSTVQKLFANKIVRNDHTTDHIHILKCIEECTDTYRGLLESVKAMSESIEAEEKSLNDKSQTPLRRDSKSDIVSDRLQLSAIRKHIIYTLRAFRNLHFAVESIDMLADLVDSRDFSNIRRLFDGFDYVFGSLTPYQTQPLIKELIQHVEVLKSQIKKDLFEELRIILPHITDNLNIQRLIDSCLLIDELFSDPGCAGKVDLCSWFIQMRLKPFTEILRKRAMKNSKMIENLSLEPLFKWLQDELAIINVEYRDIFPADWRMEQLLIYSFTSQLAKYISETLKNANDRQIDLFKPLQACKEFEKWIIKEFGTSITEQELAAAGLLELDKLAAPPVTKPIVNSNSTPSLSVYTVSVTAPEISSTPTPPIRPKEAFNGNNGDAAPKRNSLSINTGSSSSSSTSSNSLTTTGSSTSSNNTTTGSGNSSTGSGSSKPSDSSTPSTPASANPDKSGSSSAQPSPASTPPQTPAANNNADTNSAPIEEKQGFECHSALSNCFAPYLWVFVEIESEKIDEVISHMNDSDQWQILQGNSKMKARFVGCDKMMILASKAIQRYSVLFQNEVFNALVSEFKRGLTEYLRCMERRLPPINDIYDQDIHFIITCIDTADYMNERIISLTQAVTKIVHETYKSYIDFTNVQTVVNEILHKCIQLLKHHIITKLEPAFKTMQKTHWDSSGAVVDEHPFMKQIIGTLKKELTALAHISSFPYFCITFVSTFIPHFRTNLSKIGKITENIAQQLLLDCSELKSFLLHIKDSIRPRQDSIVADLPLSYELNNNLQQLDSPKKLDPKWKPIIKVVETEMGKLEQLLKVLTSPSDKIIQTYRTITNGKATQEQILEALLLRGVSVTDIGKYVKNYNATVPEALQLHVESTSKLLLNQAKSGWAGLWADAKATMYKLQQEAQKPANE